MGKDVARRSEANCIDSDHPNEVKTALQADKEATEHDVAKEEADAFKQGGGEDDHEETDPSISLQQLRDEAIEAEDIQPQKSMATRELPSREVIEEHRNDHWPPRSWYDHCMDAFGRGDAHGLVKHAIAMISMDYLFVTRKGVLLRDEQGWDDPEALKVLVVKDSMSKSVFAHAIPQKGIIAATSAGASRASRTTPSRGSS